MAYDITLASGYFPWFHNSAVSDKLEDIFLELWFYVALGKK